MRREWWKSFFRAADKRVDTPHLVGLWLLGAFVLISAWSVYHSKDHAFDEAGFGTGAAAILAVLVGHGFFSKDDDRCSPS